MPGKRMIVIGEKESFIAMVLIRKTKEAGAECLMVPWNVNDINSNIDGTDLVTLYMEDDERPPEEVLHFLADTLEERGLQMMVVGQQRDIDFVCGHIPKGLIYRTFPRPVDNSLFTETVMDYFKKVESGAFRKSILIVDDDPQYLTLIREWLKNDYKVFMANSGMQAIKMLAKNKVDLILLDHEMPITSGPKVLEMLRSESDTKDIPVIFLTGKSDKESVMAVVALRPEGYFLKGIQKEELLEKLQEFFILHKQ